MAGPGIIGRDYYSVFPLEGELLDALEEESGNIALTHPEKAVVIREIRDSRTEEEAGKLLSTHQKLKVGQTIHD